jgi:hypothetical protein
VTFYIEGFSRLVTSTTAPIATGGATVCRVGLPPTGKSRLSTAHVKLNYEIHGNSLPHFHMHFFPRYRGDQFEWQPINSKLSVQPGYGSREFERIRRAFLIKLDEIRCKDSR